MPLPGGAAVLRPNNRPMSINGANSIKYSEAEGPSGRILVVDPDEAVVEMVRAHFALNGFAVDSCDTSDALYNAELDEYRLFIIDLGIDDNGGLSVISQIKQSDNTCDIPVIACSTRISPTTIINALNNGADDYLLKPFSLRELLARANSLLRRLG